MNLEKLSKRVTQELETALSADLPAAERNAILDIVKRAMLDSSSRTHRELKETCDNLLRSRGRPGPQDPRANGQ